MEQHFTLSDGTTTLGFTCVDANGQERSLRQWGRVPMQRTSMKTGTGNLKYSDLEPPFYAAAQDDWAGGRGALTLLDDPTKCQDENGLMTWIPKKVTLGPLAHTSYSTPGMSYETYQEAAKVKLSTVYDDPDTDGMGMFAQTFTTTEGRVVTGVRIRMMSADFCQSAARVRLTGVDGSGKPNLLDVKATTRATQFWDGGAGFALGWVFAGTGQFDFDAGAVYLAAGTYAIVVDLSVKYENESIYWYGDGNAGYSGGQAWGWHQDVGDWSAVSIDLNFRLQIDYEGSACKFFTYLGGLYAAMSYGDQTTLRRRCVHRKVVSVPSRTSVMFDSGVTFTSSWIGETIRIVSGTGAGQSRKITAVPTAQMLTIGAAWDVPPDTSSVATVTTPTWDTVGGFAGRVCGVCVTGEVVYFALGPTQYIQRMRWDSSSQTYGTAADGTNKAEALVLFRDTANTPCLWRGLNYEVSNAGLQAWGTALTFGTAIRVGSGDSRITSVAVYDDRLFVGKEDGIWAIESSVPRQVPVDFSSLRSSGNCKRMIAWNLFLIFPLLHGLERLYGTQVDDFGPNKGEGLPSGRNGPIVDLLPLPGMVLAVVDGGNTGYSSIMLYNTLGWHEVIRGAQNGRMAGVWYEVLADGEIRLWYNEGGSLCYANMSALTFDRSLDSRMDYAATGEMVTLWAGTDLADVPKIWHEVAIFWERAGATLTLYYQRDNETAWTSVGSTTTDGVVRFALGNVSAKRLRLKIGLARGSTTTQTPVLHAITIEAVGRVGVKHAYQTHAVLEPQAVTVNGRADGVDVAEVLAKLDAWSGATTALTLRHTLAEFDSKTVVLEPVAYRLVQADAVQTRRVVGVSLVEV